MKIISIISPVYNEAANLPELIEKFLKLKNVLEKKNYYLKVVFINDGSLDNSEEIIINCKKKNDFINFYSLSKNFGHQEAIFAGLKETVSDYYGVIDSDLQQDPMLFDDMLQNFKDHNCEVVQMQKKYTNYENKIKIFFSKFFYNFFNKLTNINLKSGSSDFYLISRDVRDLIIKSHISKNFIRGFIHSLGFNTMFIQYVPGKRVNGKSNFNLMQQLDFAITGLYYYGKKISLYVLVLSIFIFLFSLIYLAYLVFSFFFLDTIVQGWSSIVVLVLFFGTLNIFLSSILIFFILKIFYITSKKPFYHKKK